MSFLEAVTAVGGGVLLIALVVLVLALFDMLRYWLDDLLERWRRK